MSKGSKKSGVAKPSYVDESLFGKHHSLSEHNQHPPVSMLLSNFSSLGCPHWVLCESNSYFVSCRLLIATIGNTKKNGETVGVSTLTKDQLRDIREKTVKGQKSEAIVIN